MGDGGGRVGGVQPAEGAAAGHQHAPHTRQDARAGPHPRRRRRRRPHALLQQEQQQQEERGPRLRLLLAAAGGHRRRRQRERAVELVKW